MGLHGRIVPRPPLHGRIVPKPDSTPDQLKMLGAALACWFDALLADLASRGYDAEGWIDRDSLKDLLSGELPQPFLLRVLPGQPSMRPKEMHDALERARAEFPMLQRALPPLLARSVSFDITVAGTRLNTDAVADSISEAIPMGWVAEVVITG